MFWLKFELNRMKWLPFRKFCATVLMIFILGTACPISVLFTLTAEGRELSKSAQVYQQVKNGVVTLMASGHGSGFLAWKDEAGENGLIVTNSHVVNETGGHLRVRFGREQVVYGQVVANDRDADVAVVWVNLKNIHSPVAISMFTPPEGEPLVMIGEKVIAIGSPIEWETHEKIMTLGVVGKFEADMIRHDASINKGNSGGPLLNYDGQVVGINTLIYSASGPAIASAVSVEKIRSALDVSQQYLASHLQEVPKADLLPDIPRDPFPLNLIMQSGGKGLPSVRASAYRKGSRYFDVTVMTPSLGYRQILQAEKRIMKKRKKRAKKKGFEISDDEYGSKNDFKFYDYTKPVVSVMVQPKPKLTKTSWVLNTISFTGALALTAASMGAGAPLLALPFVMGKQEFKRDFMNMKLQVKGTHQACLPYQSSRLPFTEDYAVFLDSAYVELIDKSYIGRYEFDSRCFHHPDDLEFVVYSEGDDKAVSIPVSDRLKARVVKDFDPYWTVYHQNHPNSSPFAALDAISPFWTDDLSTAGKRLIVDGEGDGEKPLKQGHSTDPVAALVPKKNGPAPENPYLQLTEEQRAEHTASEADKTHEIPETNSVVSEESSRQSEKTQHTKTSDAKNKSMSTPVISSSKGDRVEPVDGPAPTQVLSQSPNTKESTLGDEVKTESKAKVSHP